MRIPTTPPPPEPRPSMSASGPITPLVPLTSSRPQDAPRSTGTGAASATQSVAEQDTTPRFSVLNDFRYLTESDKEMLAAVTGETIEPGFTDRPGSASQFALQLALDRRTGELAPQQPVTSVYLRNAADALARANAGRPGFTNPYSGEVMNKATAWLDAHAAHRADLRM